MKRLRGFTLLELLMALGLLALTLGLLLAASTRSARQVQQAQDQNLATLFAENILADIGYGMALTPGQSEGVLANKRFRWKLNIKPADQLQGVKATVLGNSTTVLYEINLEMAWNMQRLRWHRLQTGQSTPGGLH